MTREGRVAYLKGRLLTFFELKALNYLKEAQLLDAYSSYNVDSINVRFRIKHKRTNLRRLPWYSAAVVDVVVHIEN